LQAGYFKELGIPYRESGYWKTPVARTGGRKELPPPPKPSEKSTERSARGRSRNKGGSGSRARRTADRGVNRGQRTGDSDADEANEYCRQLGDSQKARVIAWLERSGDDVPASWYKQILRSQVDGAHRELGNPGSNLDDQERGFGEKAEHSRTRSQISQRGITATLRKRNRNERAQRTRSATRRLDPIAEFARRNRRGRRRSVGNQEMWPPIVTEWNHSKSAGLELPKYTAKPIGEWNFFYEEPPAGAIEQCGGVVRLPTDTTELPGHCDDDITVGEGNYSEAKKHSEEGEYWYGNDYVYGGDDDIDIGTITVRPKGASPYLGALQQSDRKGQRTTRAQNGRGRVATHKAY